MTPASAAVRTGAPAEQPVPASDPSRVLGYLRRHRVGAAAGALVLTQLVLRIRVGKDGFFLGDDYVYVARVTDPAADWTTFFQPHIGHVFPGSLVWVWLVTSLAPYAWWLALGPSLLLTSLAGAGMYGLLREAVGARWGVLPALAVYLFGPFTLSASLWWAAAINYVPMQLFAISALYCQLRLVRTGATRYAAGVVLSVVLALPFFEKAVLIPVFVFLVTAWVYQRDGSALRALATTGRRWWRLWLACGVVCAVYLGGYSTLIAGDRRSAPSIEDVFDLVVTATTTTVVPGLVGGPWSWQPFPDFAGATAAPGTLASWLAAELVLLAVVASFLLRRRVGRVWAIVVLGFVVNLALLAVFRVWFWGPAVGTEYRFYADAMPFVTLCLAVAFVPMQGELDAWRRRTARRRRGTPSRRGEVVASILVTNLVVVSGTLSHVSYAPAWRDNPGRSYLTSLTTGLAGHSQPVDMFDGPVPAAFLTPLVEGLTAADVLRALPEQPRWVRQSGDPFVSTHDGVLVPGTVEGVTLQQGPVEGCGWSLGDQALPLTGSVYVWDWFVELHYASSADTPATVRLGDGSVRVELFQGVHRLVVPVLGGGDSLHVVVDSPAAGVCVGSGTVGNLVGASP
jgi:hypothetical protein